MTTRPRTHPDPSEEGYHPTADLTDEAITRVRELRGATPRKPSFLHVGHGACHTSHRTPREWIDRYRCRPAAGRHQVLPVDTRSRSQRWSARPTPPGADPDGCASHGPGGCRRCRLPGRIVFEVNLTSVRRTTVAAPLALTTGAHFLELTLRAGERLVGAVTPREPEEADVRSQ